VNDFLSIVVPLLIAAVFIGMLLFTLRFCVIDARRRGKSPLLVCLLVMISFPLGLIAWLLFRPEPTEGAGGSFRLEDHRLQ
jgi:hypothetical protein